jgi:hypothetical protein
MRRQQLIGAALAVVAIAVAGVLAPGVSGGSDSSLRYISSAHYSFEGVLEPGWQRADTRLVPLLMPREVLSIGTFSMPAGGGGNCGREPVAAIRRMRRGDALITIQEYVVTARMRPLSTRSFPPKSEQLDFEGLRFERLAGPFGAPRDQGALVMSGTIPFSESGRAFDALVYFRGRPSLELRRAASRALAELRFGERA